MSIPNEDEKPQEGDLLFAEGTLYKRNVDEGKWITAAVNGVPPEWLVHYAELVEERGDADLAERIRDKIQDSTGLSHQDITSQHYAG